MARLTNVTVKGGPGLANDFQLVNDGMIALLTQLGSGFEELRPFAVHLYTNNFTPTPDSVIGDFVEATFDTYAAQNFDPVAVGINPDGDGEADMGSKIWTVGALGGGEVIYGMYALSISPTPDIFFGAARFGTPISMASIGDQLALLWKFGVKRSLPAP